MSAALYIAAKAPRPGQVKTRLARAIGDEPAAALYQAFLRDLVARFRQAPFAVGWYLTPPDAWCEIAPYVGWIGEPPRIVAQGDGDWTERQRQLFRGAAGRGEERAVLLGSDSPHVTVEVVVGALRELQRHDLVFGPTYDGGYYLIGMRGWHDVLHGIPMSSGTVLDEIMARARHLGLSVGSVETTFDVDEADDLRYLWEIVGTRSDLPATRAALELLDSRNHGAPSAARQLTGPLGA